MTSLAGGGMPTAKDILRGRLLWLMLLRMVVATILLGGAILLQLREAKSFLTAPLPGLYALIAVTYLLSLLYAFLLNKVRTLESLAYAQIAVDLILESVLIYLTGMEESIFSSIYNLSIIAGSMLLYRRGGLITASLSSLLYGGLLDMRYYGLITSNSWGPANLSSPAGIEVFYRVVVNICAFFLVAFLSSYLAEQVRASQQELEETQSDLSELTAIHENILQCLQSGLITTDRQGRITYANKGSGGITGAGMDLLMGSHISALFPKLSKEIVHNLDNDEPVEARRKTMDHFRPDGQKIHLGFSLTPLKSADGNVTGSILHFQDLTQTIAMEEHLKRVDRLATIGEMAARIAHEIRNPLASLSGSIQILRKELNLEGPNRRLMEIVMKETYRLDAILTDFLLFARPERPNIQDMDLSKDLRETLDLFMEQDKKGAPIELIQEIEPRLVLKADPEKMRQVFWNLLNNAMEAMPKGGKLWVKAKWAPSSGCQEVPKLLLEVEDSGIGIPEDIMDQIFDPFFTTKDKGTGLGLSIVHRCLESVGGRIEVRNRPGKGACFALWIPLRPLPQPLIVE